MIATMTEPLGDRPDLAHPNCRMVVSPILRGEHAE
jgi:hypothetical protein